MTQVRKILIADDDDDLRDELVEQLALHAEFEPLHAATAQTAILAAREAAPDLIIMDVGPAGHGWTRGRAAIAR